MVSFLTMIVNTITSALLYVVKAFFSMLTWFLKMFGKLLKFFYIILPLTSVVFTALLVLNIVLLVKGGIMTGNTAVSGGVPQGLESTLGVIDSIDSDSGEQARSILQNNSFNLGVLFNSLKIWWSRTLSPYKGTLTHTILIILAVIMFVPVMAVFLCWSVLSSFGVVLFLAIVADAALYVLRAILGQSFSSQIGRRYYRLFREAGKRHEEKMYQKNLRQRNRELEEELRERKQSKWDRYYDEMYDESEDEYEDEDVDEEYYEDYEDEKFDEEYDEEDYDEDYDDEEDWDEEDEEEPAPAPAPAASAFNFFAGCNSRESVDKKYKSLVKLYHPDNMDGDTAALQEINAQYAEAKKHFG